MVGTDSEEARMSTNWPEFQRHMRESYKLAEDTPNMMSMVWTYEDGRSQKIVVRRFQAFDRDMLEFKSAFARRDEIEPEVLLADNSRLPLATVALSGDVYLVVYNAPADALTVDTFEFVLSRVADVADTLEEKYCSHDDF